MDAVAGLLYEVRSSGALFGRSIMTPPWSVRYVDRTPLTLVTMLRGQGWIIPDGEPRVAPVSLADGEVAIVVGPEAFSVADTPDPATPPLYVMYGPDRCTTADGKEIDDDLALGVRTCGESLDGPTVLLTGSYHVRGQVSERLLGALPRVLAVPHEGQLCPVLDLTVGGDRPGRTGAAGDPGPAAGPTAADHAAGVVRPPGGRSARLVPSLGRSRGGPGIADCCTTSQRASGP